MNKNIFLLNKTLLGGASGKEPACRCRSHERLKFDPWVGKVPWRQAWQPLQYSCLENPLDRGAWRASVHGVAESPRNGNHLAHTHICLCWASLVPQTVKSLPAKQET